MTANQYAPSDCVDLKHYHEYRRDEFNFLDFHVRTRQWTASTEEILCQVAPQRRGYNFYEINFDAIAN